MTYIATQTVNAGQISISNHIKDLGIDNMRQEIINGLTAPQKYISSKFFYDDKGSKLFEDITNLPEYYPTRTEKSILKAVAPELMSSLRNIDIVELGSGDSSKITILLEGISSGNMSSISYIPVDVSHSAIQKSAGELIKQFPDLTIQGLVADFIHQMDLIPSSNKRMFCFLGSTLGNFDENIARDFLHNISSNMNSGDTLLLGLDMVKSTEILHNAYNDSKGITAQFNKNILNVVNEIIQSGLNPDDFEHKAFFNDDKSRIEMHLAAKKDIVAISPFSKTQIKFTKGETIHTENSYKFSADQIKEFEQGMNLSIQKIYNDKNKWFGLVLFQKE